ncbi:hypothetical protein LYNGBM3L_38470 [Moorena producens 3L]|uniref:Uncharacterized protein n=1 Tax=Moorena producens 3L TaxID=489825 RepID=F4XQ78_9CYAN|nr:hypothetical protein LYNGBM3L_38470 [Moorena producens 3L]OLT68669.1 hypothetical protein BI334_29945 [Moorena producens 3L]
MLVCQHNSFKKKTKKTERQRCRGATRGEFNSPRSRAPKRSWGASAVLGVPPMSNWRGFPHSRFASREGSPFLKPSGDLRVASALPKAIAGLALVAYTELNESVWELSHSNIATASW